MESCLVYSEAGLFAAVAVEFRVEGIEVFEVQVILHPPKGFPEAGG